MGGRVFHVDVLHLTLFVTKVTKLCFFFGRAALLVVYVYLAFLPLFVLMGVRGHFFVHGR